MFGAQLRVNHTRSALFAQILDTTARQCRSTFVFACILRLAANVCTALRHSVPEDSATVSKEYCQYFRAQLAVYHALIASVINALVGNLNYLRFALARQDNRSPGNNVLLSALAAD